MSNQWGPLISSRHIGILFVVFFAVLAWFSGHIMWMVKNNERPAPWVFRLFNKEQVEKSNPYRIYINKGIAWIINLFWAWMLLFKLNPEIYEEPYEPIVGNVMLADIGGVMFELFLFFIIIGLLKRLSKV